MRWGQRDAVNRQAAFVPPRQPINRGHAPLRPAVIIKVQIVIAVQRQHVRIPRSSIAQEGFKARELELAVAVADVRSVARVDEEVGIGQVGDVWELEMRVCECECPHFTLVLIRGHVNRA